MSDPKPSLIQKLISVYEKIDHIEKRGTNQSPGQGNYKYVKATDLAHAVRKALLELNVYAEVNFRNERQYTIARAEGKSPFNANDVTCTIVFKDGDSNEELTASGLGTGADMSDKAIYKAQTAALKYALRNAFIVPDDADPEGDATVDEKETKTTTQTTRPNNPPKTAPAGPPKAEIPNETKQSSGSNTSTASASDHSLPSAEELNTYRVRFGKLVDALSTAGLKSSKGLPLQKKVLVFLLESTKQDAAEKISKANWETFFSNVGSVSNGDGGISKLVELVNSAVGGTN